MKVAKISFSAVITISLIWLLNSSWVIGGSRIPPLGKFLDPFHGFWNNIEPINKTGEEKLTIPGLKNAVTVIYDSILIPHIFAQNDADLYLAQGYVTAQHRLWQMEFQTHAAAGRVTEITGPGKDGVILNFDRGQRRLGMNYGAEHVLEKVMKDSTSKLMVEKYTEGINQYIQLLGYGDLSFEYKLLDYNPEPWTPIKCALLLQTMAKTLNMGDKDIEMTNALKLFGKDMVDILYPDNELVGDPIVDNAGGWKFNPIKLDSIPLALPDELITAKKMPGEDPTTGSNNWAVSGSKTTTGSPMLCGDPHLNLNLPSIWFAIQLNAPGVNTMGVSIPGAPAVIIGFNDSIAWSETNAQRDAVDWYAITYQNNNRDQYLLDEKWIPTRKQIEKFSVRGEPVFYDTVIYTTWGPVTYDRNYHAKADKKEYSFRWTAHDASNEFLAFYLLNRGKNHHDYMEALNHYEAPAQNFVFASVSGDVAMRIQGKYPVRRKEEGKFTLDGSKSSMGWKAFIPNEQNVMYKNPARGFVSSANQYPVDATYPYYVTGTHFEAYRNRRINEVLGASNKIDVDYLMRLQNDTYNLKAAESLPVFLNYIDSISLSNEEKEAYSKLKSWDYYNTISSEGASYYEAWWDNLMPLIWDELDTETKTLYIPTTFNTIHLIKTKPDFTFFDIQSTPEKETAKDLIRQAFKLGVAAITDWKKEHSSETVNWAAYKDSYVGYLLSSIEPMNIHITHGGNHDIVNANSKTHGPSWRMVVSLEKSGIKCWATYPGGQSGNPGSEHFADMLTRWVKGQYYPMLFMHSPKDNATQQFYSTQFNSSSK